jgi:hypothetical protein
LCERETVQGDECKQRERGAPQHRTSNKVHKVHKVHRENKENMDKELY